MFRYIGFGLAIESELELPELTEWNASPEVIIRLGRVEGQSTKATLTEEVAITRRVARFLIRSGSEIVVDPVPGCDPTLLRVILLGKIMAFLLRQRGWLPLHASGVSINGEGVVFLGPSGTGKSTIAAAFHRRGHQVITDDVGAVRQVEGCWMIRFGCPRLRLNEDSTTLLKGRGLQMDFQSDKHSVSLPPPAEQHPFPLRRVYILGYGDRLRTELIPPLPAVTLLDTHTFTKRWRMTSEVLSRQLEQCAAVAGGLPVRRLIRPRSLSALGDVVALVESELASDV